MTGVNVSGGPWQAISSSLVLLFGQGYPRRTEGVELRFGVSGCGRDEVSEHTGT